MRPSTRIPSAPPSALRVGPDKATKTEMLAVRKQDPVPIDSQAASALAPAPPSEPLREVELATESGHDDEDRPTGMRDWNAESLARDVDRTRGTLVRMDPTCAGMTLVIPDQAQRFGRGREADVCVDDEAVSRLHAAIRRTANGYEIVDLESRNGTVVSGRRVHRAQLRDGDIVQLGPRVSFRFSLMTDGHAEVMRRLFESSVRDSLTGRSTGDTWKTGCTPSWRMRSAIARSSGCSWSTSITSSA